MRKISAHYIINPGEKPIKNGILELDEEGAVLNLRTSDQIKEESQLEFFSGVLVPGFINVHCHLELSHLKNKIEPHTGISHFVQQVVAQRNLQDPDHKLIQNQLYKMFQTGTQAIGDISNTNHSLTAKSGSPVQVHTFIELFGLFPDKADEVWEKGTALLEAFRQAGQAASMTPHAPYSVSVPLWQKFDENPEELKFTISLHNQESHEEEEFMQHHTGPFVERFSNMGIPRKNFPGPAKSAPHWYQKLLPDFQKLLLIHNTFTNLEDIQFLSEENPGKEIFFGLCPLSNLFIENQLPHELVKNRKGLNLCIGTDSLASNHQLSIWEEIKALAKAYPNIPIGEFIEMATQNGARALGLEKEIGSFELGKKPGVILLEGINPESLSIQKMSQSRRIV